MDVFSTPIISFLCIRTIMGINMLSEKWNHYFSVNSYWTVSHKYSIQETPAIIPVATNNFETCEELFSDRGRRHTTAFVAALKQNTNRHCKISKHRNNIELSIACRELICMRS